MQRFRILLKLVYTVRSLPRRLWVGGRVVTKSAGVGGAEWVFEVKMRIREITTSTIWTIITLDSWADKKSVCSSTDWCSANSTVWTSKNWYSQYVFGGLMHQSSYFYGCRNLVHDLIVLYCSEHITGGHNNIYITIINLSSHIMINFGLHSQL